MSGTHVSACRRCGGETPEGKLDPSGWCDACRAEIIPRAAVWGWVACAAVAVLYLAWMVWAGMFGTLFLVAWLVLGAALAFLALKVARRVAFEVIRARAAAPPR